MKTLSTIFVLLALFAVNSPAGAYAFTDTAQYFGDTKTKESDPSNSIYSYTSGQSTVKWSGFPSLTSTDVNGTPDITGGEFIFSGTSLVGINITVDKKSSTLFNNIKPGDWFFDINQDARWDYVIHSSTIADKTTTATGDWNIFNVNAPIFNNGTVLTSNQTTNNTNYPQYINSYVIGSGVERKNQPVGYNTNYGGSDIGDATLSNWNRSAGTANNVFTAHWALTPLDFGSLNNEILWGKGKSFTYAFAVSCANDMLYSETAPIPNPEPGTMLLMGAGALGAAFLRRRSNAKNV